MRTASLLAAFVALTALAPSQTPPRRPRETDGNKLVGVKLLADHASIRPGQRFELAVQLSVKPGWHIYWEHPGDAGTPTTADLSGPEGFEIESVRFPSPHAHREEGDITSNILEGEVLLLAEVRAPEKLPATGSLLFEVEASWLVCTDYCLTGAGRARLELPVAAADAKAVPAQAELFARARKALPQSLAAVLGADRAPRVEHQAAERRLTVVLDVPEAEHLEYYAAEPPGVLFKQAASARHENGLRLTLSYDLDEGQSAPRTRGVLRIKTARGEQCCWLETGSRPAR